MAVESELENQDDSQNQDLDSCQHPHLCHPVPVHESVDDAFQEWPCSISDYHQGIGGFEPEHITKEVLSQFAILAVVVGIACEGSQDHEEQDQGSEDLQEFRRQVQTERSQEISESEEGEELDIPHDQDLEEHPPEGVGSEEDADLEVEQAAKESVEDDEE